MNSYIMAASLAAVVNFSLQEKFVTHHNGPPGPAASPANTEPWTLPFFHRQQKFDFFRDGIWDRKLREVEPDAAFPRRRSKARFDIGPINHTYEKRRYVLQTLARCFAGCVHNISMLKLFKKWYSCSD